MDNLRVVFQWRQVDYDFPSEAERREAVSSREFIPENNLPLGLEVYGERVFVTVPRWKSGIPASLTYIKLTGKLSVECEKVKMLKRLTREVCTYRV